MDIWINLAPYELMQLFTSAVDNLKANATFQLTDLLLGCICI